MKSKVMMTTHLLFENMAVAMVTPMVKVAPMMKVAVMIVIIYIAVEKILLKRMM